MDDEFRRALQLPKLCVASQAGDTDGDRGLWAPFVKVCSCLKKETSLSDIRGRQDTQVLETFPIRPTTSGSGLTFSGTDEDSDGHTSRSTAFYSARSSVRSLASFMTAADWGPGVISRSGTPSPNDEF